MNADLTHLLDITFAGNTVRNYLMAVGVFAGVFIVLKLVLHVVWKRLEKWWSRAKWASVAVQFFHSMAWLILPLVSLLAALKFLQVPLFISQIIQYIILASVLWIAVLAAQRVLDFGLQAFMSKRRQDHPEGEFALFEMTGKFLKIMLWVLAAVILLQNLGYDINALVAGLGISGIAVALAAQNILSDIFASFSIYLDRPFQVGDFIIVGDDKGQVKKIGIKTTRLQTPQGEELIIANRELTSSRVHNFRRMDRRRVEFRFGVTSDTSSDKLEKIPGMLKEVIGRLDRVDFEGAYFKEFGAGGLVFEVTYYVHSNQYNKYREVQQAINLGLKKAFEMSNIIVTHA